MLGLALEAHFQTPAPACRRPLARENRIKQIQEKQALRPNSHIEAALLAS